MTIFYLFFECTDHLNTITPNQNPIFKETEEQEMLHLSYMLSECYIRVVEVISKWRCLACSEETQLYLYRTFQTNIQPKGFNMAKLKQHRQKIKMTINRLKITTVRTMQCQKANKSQWNKIKIRDKSSVKTKTIYSAMKGARKHIS